MKKLIALITLLIASSVMAEEKLELKELYGEHEGVVYAISNIPCPFPEMQKHFPWTAKAIEHGEKFKRGCYGPISINDIMIVFEDGSNAELPANLFLLPQNRFKKQPELPDEEGIHI